MDTVGCRIYGKEVGGGSPRSGILSVGDVSFYGGKMFLIAE